MKVGVVVFPGSNCDHDALYAASHNAGLRAEFLWHEDPSIGNNDAIILPGGFSYGDYLRCGAIAKFSPIMAAIKRFAAAGGLVLGVCNGFQVLVESGLLPGALLRNQELRFVCKPVALQIETTDSPFTNTASEGQTVTFPVAHGEGCYYADDRTLDELEAEQRVAFRYLSDVNGSSRRIAGILNAKRNVLGLMPHPERATEALVGGTDGLLVFQSMSQAYASRLTGAA